MPTTPSSTAIEPVRLSPRERQKAETRSLILAAAEQLFAERGYALVSLDEVGELAGGYSKGAVYASFGTKADLLLAVLEHDFAGVSDALAAALQAARKPEDMVDALATWHGERLESGRAWSRMLPDLLATARYDEAARERLDGHLAFVENAITELLTEQEGRLGIKFEVRPPVAAALAIATFHGLAVRSLVNGQDPTELFTESMRGLLRPRPPRKRTTR